MIYQGGFNRFFRGFSFAVGLMLHNIHISDVNGDMKRQVLVKNKAFHHFGNTIVVV
jgi:hypothetical protein